MMMRWSVADRKILLMDLKGLLEKMKEQDRGRTCCIMTIKELEEIVECVKQQCLEGELR